MKIEPKLKPLYVNLKRLNLGNYLNTKEFEYYMIEKNFDKTWEKCLSNVRLDIELIDTMYHDNELEEKAFGIFMSLYYTNNYLTFGNFITNVLLKFSVWNQTQLDFSLVHENLKQIGLSDKNVLKFINKARKIRDSKPIEIDESNKTKAISNSIVNLKNVFIVHGHDNTARLELNNIIKDDFQLNPIVLQDEPNTSIETIISKFERLASICSSAIILFTPDDESNGKFRARQNVILELGYFLGKFQDFDERKLVIIKQKNIEIPSDISGVLYLEYDKSVKEIYYNLNKQFQAWGYK